MTVDTAIGTTDYTARLADRPDTFPRGRVCCNGCRTVLSIYNPNESCWICTDKLERELAANDSRHRVWFSHRRLTPDVIEHRLAAIAELRERGLTWRAIGGILHVSPGPLSMFWSDYGGYPRREGERHG